MQALSPTAPTKSAAVFAPADAGCLHVLFVEDSEDDALLMLRELRRSGYAPCWRRVDTATSLLAALGAQPWDVVLCDYVMPQFSAPAALRILRELTPDLPVIIVSGEIGEEVAVSVMKAGAFDYVMKGRLARLVPAVERELREAANRRIRRQAEQALRESEERFRSLIENASDMIVLVGADARAAYASPAVERVLGWTVSDLGEFRIDDLLHPDDRSRVDAVLDDIRRGARPAAPFGFRCRHCDGTWRWIEAVGTATADGVVLNARDVTERRRTEEEKEVLLEVAGAIAGTLDLQEVLGRVQRRTAALLPCDRVLTCSWESAPPRLRVIARSGDAGNGRSAEFCVEEPIAARLHAGATVVIADGGGMLPGLGALAGEETCAVLAVPLVVRGCLSGAFVAVRAAVEGAFDRDAVRRFEGIARQVAVAIGTAELSREREEEAQTTAALARVGEEMITLLDGSQILDRLCARTVELLGCDTSHTLLWQAAEDAYRPAAGRGYAAEVWNTAPLVLLPRSLFAGLLGRLEETDTVEVAFADAVQPLVPLHVAERFGIGAALYVGLRRGREIIGLHAACYRRPEQRFSARQQRLARGIAQLAALALENARLVEKLECTGRVKAEFVATVSHELRTPLNIITGYVSLLRDGAFDRLTPEQDDVLHRVQASAESLAKLVNATLDLGRLEAGRLPLSVTDVRLAELVAALDAENPAFRAKPGVCVELHVPGDLPVLRTDATRLKAVLANLIDNAVKFTPAGTVSVEAWPRDGGVELAVRDTGIGMTPDILSIVFEAFRQGDGSMTREHGGLGLGLHVARRLLDLLDGTIRITSAPGAGTVCRVWVPSRPDAT